MRSSSFSSGDNKNSPGIYLSWKVKDCTNLFALFYMRHTCCASLASSGSSFQSHGIPNLASQRLRPTVIKKVKSLKQTNLKDVVGVKRLFTPYFNLMMKDYLCLRCFMIPFSLKDKLLNLLLHVDIFYSFLKSSDAYHYLCFWQQHP